MAKSKTASMTALMWAGVLSIVAVVVGGLAFVAARLGIIDLTGMGIDGLGNTMERPSDGKQDALDQQNTLRDVGEFILKGEDGRGFKANLLGLVGL